MSKITAFFNNADYVNVIDTIDRHSSPDASDFTEFLNHNISQFNASKMYYFILGDVNIPLLLRLLNQ